MPVAANESQQLQQLRNTFVSTTDASPHSQPTLQQKDPALGCSSPAGDERPAARIGAAAAANAANTEVARHEAAETGQHVRAAASDRVKLQLPLPPSSSGPSNAAEARRKLGWAEAAGNKPTTLTASNVSTKAEGVVNEEATIESSATDAATLQLLQDALAAAEATKSTNDATLSSVQTELIIANEAASTHSVAKLELQTALRALRVASTEKDATLATTQRELASMKEAASAEGEARALVEELFAANAAAEKKIAEKDAALAAAEAALASVRKAAAADSAAKVAELQAALAAAEVANDGEDAALAELALLKKASSGSASPVSSPSLTSPIDNAAKVTELLAKLVEVEAASAEKDTVLFTTQAELNSMSASTDSAVQIAELKATLAEVQGKLQQTKRSLTEKTALASEAPTNEQHEHKPSESSLALEAANAQLTSKTEGLEQALAEKEADAAAANAKITALEALISNDDPAAAETEIESLRAESSNDTVNNAGLHASAQIASAEQSVTKRVADVVDTEPTVKDSHKENLASTSSWEMVIAAADDVLAEVAEAVLEPQSEPAVKEVGVRKQKRGDQRRAMQVRVELAKKDMANTQVEPAADSAVIVAELQTVLAAAVAACSGTDAVTKGVLSDSSAKVAELQEALAAAGVASAKQDAVMEAAMGDSATEVAELQAALAAAEAVSAEKDAEKEAALTLSTAKIAELQAAAAEAVNEANDAENKVADSAGKVSELQATMTAADGNASEAAASSHAELEQCLFEKHLELKSAQMAIQKLEEHIASIDCAQNASSETTVENSRLVALVAELERKLSAVTSAGSEATVAESVVRSEEVAAYEASQAEEAQECAPDSLNAAFDDQCVDGLDSGRAVSREESDDFFELYDTDSSGTVDTSELLEMVASFKQKAVSTLNQSKIKQVWDADGDGTVRLSTSPVH